MLFGSCQSEALSNRSSNHVTEVIQATATLRYSGVRSQEKIVIKPGKTYRKYWRNMGENIETIGQSRELAWGLLTEYTKSESLRKHARAVEACMRAYAQKYARENGLNQSEAAALEQKYSVTAVLHDFDYEQFPTPEQHPFVGNKIL